MSKKKILALLLCLALIIGVTLPTTLAVSSDTDVPSEPAPEEPIDTEEPADPVDPDEPSVGADDPVRPDGCTCDFTDGQHSEDCALYVEAPEENPEENSDEDPFETLYDDLMSAASMDEFEAICALYTDDELAQFEQWVVENGLLGALQAHIYTFETEASIPETVVFTDAGPFMPPVTVQSGRRPLRAPSTGDNNGLELSKTATLKEDGSYTIRMEAYTTGTVTTTTTAVPVDIVLVLDQSGSMADSFGNTTRQAAMKEAVNNFIGAVAEKYTAEADHRMAIVTFGTNASTLQGWTSVDTSGKNTLQGKINGLPRSPSGATNAGAGMEQAEALMDSGYSYTGKNTNRQKVVVFFTDGVPTTESDFDTDVADTAIALAKNLKNSGVTVYSVGIFNGANTNELYGASGFDRNSDGTVGSNWSDFSWWMIGDVKNYDVPAGNRFLNYLSSNFADTSSIGIKNYKSTIFGIGYHGWEITKNFDRTASGYYLTASDSASLNNIFQTISKNIQEADIDLGARTEIRDIVTPYFTAPTDSSKITLCTAEYLGNNQWGKEVDAAGVEATVSGKTVSVTGFNFNDHFVTETAKEDDTYGSKLIIEFTVEPEAGFLGGNGVPTNGSDSGVYLDDTVLEKFDVPTVDVPIPDVTVTAVDKNVYLLHTMKEKECKDGATATCGGVNLLDEALYTDENAAWKAEFVEITVSVVKPANALTEDADYTISAKVEPKTGNKSAPQSGEATGKINVFKPELTYKDGEAYYGATAPNSAALNECLTKTVWKHNGAEANPSTMIGEAPKLDKSYTFEGGKIANNMINTKQDIGVNVYVKIGDTDVTEKTTFVHTPCVDMTCDLTGHGNAKFLLHVKTCTLTITKTGGATNEPYVFTIYKDGEEYSEVTIMGNGSVTLYELPVGTYTIKEDTGWSWRYTANNGSAVELSAVKPAGTITCANEKANDFWLNGFSAVVKNIFGVKH